VRVTNHLLDAEFRLVGDEDCGVGIDCQVCDRGGVPIAYYTWPGNHVYENTDVKVVHTIAVWPWNGTPMKQAWEVTAVGSVGVQLI